MYSFFDIHFWYYFLYFIGAFILSIIIPGYILQRYVPIKSFSIQLLISCSVGIGMWALQGYVFGYLGFRFLTYVYLVVFLILFLKQKKEFTLKLSKLKKDLQKIDKIALLIIIFGVILQTFPTFASGMLYVDGVRFFHVNATDGILHLGYIQSMAQSFPPQEPGINSPLVNYHYWSDLVIAEFARIWHLPVMHLFFQYFVPVISLTTGLSVYALMRTWGGSKNVARWALFLLFFSGDATYLLMYILHQQIAFNAPSIDNGILQFMNMPHAMAKMVFISALIPLYEWIKTKDIRYGVLSVGILSVLVGFKVYYGIFAAIGLVCMGAYLIFESIFHTYKKTGVLQGFILGLWQQKYMILLLIVFGVIGVIIYFPANKASGGLFYSPLEWPKLFLGAGALNFEDWWLRRQVYEQAHNLTAVVFYDSIAIVITLIAVYGTRLLGLLPSKELARKLGPEMLSFFIPTVLIFNILGLYTLQKSGLFNVYNFFVVSSIILSFFASFWLSRIQKIKIFGAIFCLIFILLTIPRIYYEGRELFIQYTAEQKTSDIVPNSELEVFEYLKQNTNKNSIVQTHIKNPWDQVTPYSVFFTDRNSYLTGTRLLETHNQPVKERKEQLETLFATQSSKDFSQLMTQLNIDYIIVKKSGDQALLFKIEKPFLQIEFENNEYIVVKNLSK